MIRGNLKILVLKALAKKPLSGYALMKYIEDKIGTKPSPGSMYPLLDELTKQKFVTCKEDGRKKIYSLTKEGKEHLKVINIHKDILIKKTEESIKMWAALTGEDIKPFEQTMEALKKGKYSSAGKKLAEIGLLDYGRHPQATTLRRMAIMFLS